MLVRGQLGAAEVTGSALRDPAILRLSATMVLIDDDTYNARFPAERWAHAAVIFKDDADKFPNVDALTGKIIDITGRAKDYKGSCEIIVNDPAQLKTK